MKRIFHICIAAFMLALLALVLYVMDGHAEPKCPYQFEAASPDCNDGDVHNGYWAGIWWVPRFITLEEWYRPQPPYSSGRAVWYANGVMQANINQRIEWGQIVPGDYIDGVALMSPADLGKTVWLRRPGYGWEGPFIVADCAQRDDEWWILKYRKEVVEVGWRTKERWGITAPLDGVQVVVAESPYQLWRVLETQEMVDYPSWWLSWPQSGQQESSTLTHAPQ